jgi:hypothetical protein
MRRFLQSSPNDWPSKQSEYTPDSAVTVSWNFKSMKVHVVHGLEEVSLGVEQGQSIIQRCSQVIIRLIIQALASFAQAGVELGDGFLLIRLEQALLTPFQLLLRKHWDEVVELAERSSFPVCSNSCKNPYIIRC